MEFESKIVMEGLTFDDVLLRPAFSEVLPREVSVASKLTKNIILPLPILSAAMDTVTESALAIALARQGGMGILHKNMSIERQAQEVRLVKRNENGLILDPLTLKPEDNLGTAISMIRQNKIGGIPIVDDQGKLVGILTNRDLRFENDENKAISEVMTSENIITSDPNTDLNKAEKILNQYKIEKLPIVDEEGKLVGLITYKDIVNVKNYPNSNKDSMGRLRVGAAIGITPDALERVTALVQAGVDIITLDSAHGHSRGVIDFLKKIKSNHPDLPIIAGNVATGAGAIALADAGADVVKVGVGPGSICTTRIVTGVGSPQLSAILECAAALQDRETRIIADGGIRYTGDFVKALAAGASAVMVGSVFAGTEESPGETIIYEGRKFKSYRGMGSVEAMADGSKDRYFQDVEDDIKKLVPEGIVGRVPYKGSLEEVVYQFIGGLRAGMGYCGAKDVDTLKKTAKFVKMSAAGISESHAHDIVITKEAPNYSRR